MTELAVLVPVLGRPHRPAPLLEAFARTTPEAALYFIADRRDKVEQTAVLEAGGNLLELDGGFGTKVNYATQQTTEPLILIVGDDVEPQPGWLDAARRHLDNGSQCVGINDDIARPRAHAVHFLMTRSYAEQGTFDGQRGPCSEAYHHWYIDDEIMATAQRRGEYAYAEDAHITHLHPMADAQVPDDKTYSKGREYRRVDKRIFHRRMRGLRRLEALQPTFTICVATFGSEEWRERGDRAAETAAVQAPVVRVHEGDDVATARNLALERVESEFVIFLDADDLLESSYVAAMRMGVADLRVPACRWVRGRNPMAYGPKLPTIPTHRHAECGPACLRDGNYIVVGAAVRADLVRRVGGWESRWEVFEDWALWARCYAAGASIENIPDAVYRANHRAGSRNHTHDRAYMNKVHREIERAVWG